jgi:hypothetical protein
MAIELVAYALAAFSGTGTLLMNRYLARRDERRKACGRYWAAWDYLMNQLGALRSAVNASGALRKVATDVRQRADDAERDWRAQVPALRDTGHLDLIDAVTVHIRATEQNIAAARKGEWPPHDDGTADRRLHAAMRRHRLERRHVPGR